MSDPKINVIKAAEPSEWRCELFGSGPLGMVWIPVKGSVPNAWVRFWMRVFFNCRWTRGDCRRLPG